MIAKCGVRRILLGAGLILMSVSPPARAFTPGACRQDADKLCPQAKGKEVMPCLKQHQADLSEACKVNLAEARERVRQTRDACQTDTEKFCKDVQPGGGRVIACLKQHRSDLSKQCLDKVAETKQKLHIETPQAPE